MHEEVNKSEEKTLDATEELLAEKAASLDAEIVEELLAEDQLSETEELQEQVSKANDQVLRIQAEMQNVRRRAERDRGRRVGVAGGAGERHGSHV